MSKRRKLRNYWLIPAYQGRYVGFLLASCLAAMAGYGLVFYRFIRENYDTLVELSPMDDTSRRVLQGELNTITIYLVVVSIVFLLCVGVIGIVFSHKVAGPMYKIGVVCNDIIKGNLGKRIALRPGDDFREVVGRVNKAFNALHISHSNVYRIVQGESHLNEPLPIERLHTLMEEGKISATSLVVPNDHPEQSPVPLTSVLADFVNHHRHSQPHKA